MGHFVPRFNYFRESEANPSSQGDRTPQHERVGHYGARWGWDILSPIDEISHLMQPDILYQGDRTFCTKVQPISLVSNLFARKEKTSPIYIFPIWVFLLNGAAQSPRPLLRFTPGYAAVRQRNDLATARTAEGNPSRGVPPDPLPPCAHKGLEPKG